MIQLFDYQQKGVDDIRNAFRTNDNVLFVLPTGGGKTVVFSEIARLSVSKGSNVLILVHRIELLRQTSKALNKSGVKHGIINPKYTPSRFEKVQVASVQTLVKRLDQIDPPDLIIVDECHHAVSSTYKKITDYFFDARTLGVSATPIRSDGKGLNDCYDEIVSGPQISELIKRKRLVKPVMYAPPTNINFSKIKIVRGDYDKKEMLEIIDKPTITGDAVKHYTKLCPKTPAVAFCISIEHAEHVANEFRSAGYSAYSVDGTMDDETRTRILNGLGNGSVDVVASCDLISEGTDIPAIGCAILLRRTLSMSLYLQQVGRALRTVEGKTQAIILDHVGNYKLHGFPEDDREWSLEGTKKGKRGKQEREETLKVSQCESCYAVFEPAPICPICGEVQKRRDNMIEQVDGELELITEAQKIAIKQSKRIEIARAKKLEDLQELEKKYGYKRGWANHLFKSRNEKLF